MILVGSYHVTKMTSSLNIMEKFMYLQEYLPDHSKSYFTNGIFFLE